MSGNLRIVTILNNREVAIAGTPPRPIEDGDIFRVLGEPTQIRDPDSNELLGEIVNTKTVVRAYSVQEKFILARTFRQQKVNVGGSGIGGLSGLFEPPKYETRTETLERDPKKNQEISASQAIVEVGDRVELYDGDLNDIPKSTIWR